MARLFRRPTLSVTLSALIVLLLVLTVGAIAVIGRISQLRSTEDLLARISRANTLMVGYIVSGVLTPAPPLLEEIRSAVVRGRLDIADSSVLDDLLVERLRHQPTMDRFSYSDEAGGHFHGAWRRADGAIILITSAPDVDGGRPVEVEVTADGRRVPFLREESGGYDPRQRVWYRQAIASDGVIWSDPYQLNVGSTGITAAVAVRDPSSGALRGVFTADFFLDDISRYIADQTRGRTRVRHPLYAVVTRGGQLVADAATPGADSGSLVARAAAADGDPRADLLHSALAAVPADLQKLALGSPLIFTFYDKDARYYAQLQAFPVTRGLEMIVIAAFPEDELLEVVDENQRIAIGVGLVLLLASLVLASLLARRIARPLRLISVDLEKVGRFEISATPAPQSFVQEIGVVGDAVDRMKASLRSFGRYVPRALVQELLASGHEARLGGQSQCLTIYFSDIEGFTRISESLEPHRLVEHLGEYLDAMATIIEEQHGTVDKFLGDGIMALFGAPRAVPDHAAEACRAALRSQRRLQELAKQWQAHGKPVLRARIGLHTGDLIVGNIGTPNRFEFTVIGDAVNLASRLEGLNKIYGTYLMASQAVRDAAGMGFEWRTLDRVAVVGRADGTLVSELLGETGTVGADVLAARDLYESALAAYFAMDFARAADGFRAAARPDDHAASVMAARAEQLAGEPVPIGWDGVYHATAK